MSKYVYAVCLALGLFSLAIYLNFNNEVFSWIAAGLIFLPLLHFSVVNTYKFFKKRNGI